MVSEKRVQFFFWAFGPKIRGVQKLPKKVVFWLKKCEKIRIRHPLFFSQIFYRTNAVENALCTKKIFFNGKTETLFLKKIRKFLKFPKVCKVIFLIPKSKKKRFFVRRLGMFGAFGDFGALFLYKENEKYIKKVGLRCIP